MENKNLTQAKKHKELILKLLDVVNSQEEYLYLQEELALAEATLAHLPSRSISARKCN